MTNIIEHAGIVENIQDSHVRVRITQVSGCATCSAKGYCSSADKSDKIIDVTTADGSTYHIGDKVKVQGKTSIGLLAVLLAFIFPFFLIIITLFVSKIYVNNELYVALFSLLVLIPYYLILWLNKTRLKRDFSFTIKPINI